MRIRHTWLIAANLSSVILSQRFSYVEGTRWRKPESLSKFQTRLEIKFDLRTLAFLSEKRLVLESIWWLPVPLNRPFWTTLDFYEKSKFRILRPLEHFWSSHPPPPNSSNSLTCCRRRGDEAASKLDERSSSVNKRWVSQMSIQNVPKNALLRPWCKQ